MRQARYNATKAIKDAGTGLPSSFKVSMGGGENPVPVHGVSIPQNECLQFRRREVVNEHVLKTVLSNAIM